MFNRTLQCIYSGLTLCKPATQRGFEEKYWIEIHLSGDICHVLIRVFLVKYFTIEYYNTICQEAEMKKWVYLFNEVKEAEKVAGGSWDDVKALVGGKGQVCWI
jgi:hypothetical protein